MTNIIDDKKEAQSDLLLSIDKKAISRCNRRTRCYTENRSFHAHI
jgi:hypothetical protein